MATFQSNYLSSVRKQFAYYRLLGDKTFEQLEDVQLFELPASNSNSIAIIVNHLWGNMMSRWTDFLSSDGEKSWRDRDTEFEDIIVDKETMLERWNEGWDCLFTALDSIDEENFSTTVYIRNQGHTITEAINRQLAHYAYHVGQIVFIGRMYSRQNWNSLSIPKGGSEAYNDQKFAKDRHQAHFTDEFLNLPDED